MRPWEESKVTLYPDFDIQKDWVHKRILFQAVKFAVVCHAALENWYSICPSTECWHNCCHVPVQFGNWASFSFCEKLKDEAPYLSYGNDLARWVTSPDLRARKGRWSLSSVIPSGLIASHENKKKSVLWVLKFFKMCMAIISEDFPYLCVSKSSQAQLQTPSVFMAEYNPTWQGCLRKREVAQLLCFPDFMGYFNFLTTSQVSFTVHKFKSSLLCK